MQSYNARFASFTTQLRSKSSSKGTSDFRWPHPASFLATPASLASAGFYFNPSSETPDAVSCFICDKGLAHWDPEDDPVEIHLQKRPDCPWAMLKCVTDINDNGSLKVTSSSRLPLSRAMEKARLATFSPYGKKWWPHDAKNKVPTSKMMAKAGFVYSPVDDKDDTCTCIYCGIELAGWEPEDDPMEEHRSRQAKTGPCPFFTSSSVVLESTRRVRSKSKPAPVTPVASSSDQEYHTREARSSARSSNNKPSGSNTKSKSTKTSKKAPKAKAIEEEVVTEYRIALDADEDAPPKPRPRPRRASSRSRSRSTSSSTRSRSRASSTRSTTTEDINVDLRSTSPAPVSKKKPRSKDFQSPDIPLAAASAPQAVSKSSQHLKHIPSIPLALKAVSHTPSNSFESSEDEELAREEQALEEQARQLMLADTTLQLDASLPHVAKDSIAKSHDEVAPDASFRNSHKAPTTRGKDKAKAPPVENSTINNTVSPPTVTPSTPPRLETTTKTAFASVIKFPQLLPDATVATLTESERAMTVEQWIRHEMDRQYERLQSDGRQKIDAFKARAIEVARQIERL